MTTKEQERQALRKIRSIINALGPDSYIGTAFEGCFEIAEENIDGDMACSMMQSRDSWARIASERSSRCVKLAKELGAVKAELEAVKNDRDFIQEQLDSTRRQLHAAYGDADGMENKVDDLEEELKTVKAERDALKTERDKLKAERDFAIRVGHKWRARILELESDLQQEREATADIVNKLDTVLTLYRAEQQKGA